MQLLTYTDYALRVLIYVGAHTDRPVPASAIAEAYGISHAHVAKAAKELRRRGLLRARRGAGGGVQLARPASKIRIGEVVRMFEEDRGLVDCFRADAAPCKIQSACRLRGAIARAAEAFYRELDRCSLADLVEERPRLVRLLRKPHAAPARRKR